MVSRKYTGDYRLENIVNPSNGKIETRPVYRGDLFSFSCTPQRLKTLKGVYCGCSAAAVAVFLTALFINTRAGHILYVMFPFALLVFPLYYNCAGCVRLLSAKEQVTREHRDKISTRLSGSSAFTALFSGISAVGHAVYWIRYGETLPDLVLLGAALIVFAAGIVMFRFRRELVMVKTGSAADSV